MLMSGHRNVGFRNRSVSQSRFAMVPRADIPRSVFRTEFTHKTTFDAGWLIPIYLDEVLPGDSFKVDMTAFARLSTPLFPIMDNLHLDTFFFFCPWRLLWANFEKFMGANIPNPDSPTDYLIPQVLFNSANPIHAASGTLSDYFGIPVREQLDSSFLFSVSAFPFRAYNLIYNEWFRDENLQDSRPITVGDSAEAVEHYQLVRRGKRHDYFTSCLPWPQKGDPVALPLGLRAPISGLGVVSSVAAVDSSATNVRDSVQQGVGIYDNAYFIPHPSTPTADQAVIRATASGTGGIPDVYADLSQATSATINQLRQAFQIQKLLERDARGGTRYTEIVRSHFGVMSPDARLQRPEYLGGGSTPVQVSPVAQTVPEDTSPLGRLGAVGTSVARNGFSQSFTEHGLIIGLCSVRADLTYQQGIHRSWFRSTRYDVYWPAFAHLGEQAVLRRELVFKGLEPQDSTVFGYQERWAEYRYHPSLITGKFRSGITGTLDQWHLSQNLGSAPELGDTFISENPPMARILAAGELAAGQQILFDSVFSVRMVRPLPAYSVPGFIDRF